MRKILFLLILLFPLFVSGQNNDIQNMSVLANQYYQNKEFGKAGEMYEKLYQATKAEVYFTIYLDCLFNIPDYEKAEKEIRKGMRGNSSDGFWYIQWGYLKKNIGKPAEANDLYEKAINSVSNNEALLPNLANQFFYRREFDYAEKVYLKARALQNQNPSVYSSELGRVYYYTRNYDMMMKEYIEWSKQNIQNIESVKGMLQSVLVMDNDGEISKQIKTYLLKQLQTDPGQLISTRLLIWLFTQDKNFAAATRQAIALDKRTGQESANIFGLANVSATNKNYDEAIKAYDYLIGKGKTDQFYSLSNLQRMQSIYERFIDFGSPDTTGLKAQFLQTLSVIGRIPESSQLLTNYAHFLTFYLNQPSEATRVLNEAMSIPGINLQHTSLFKAELSDIQVYTGDLWEAVITYSQVIETNKGNQLGDEMKLKKAKLGYYMGNFSWAKAQLDVLKASTSKLIANDAMELALFIGENLEADSVAVPLQIFARADLALFRHHYPEAMATLDSIGKKYPFNSLSDDVNFRKANIFQKQGNYAEAAVLLESIVKDNSWEMLADDALFQLAAIYQTKLNRKDEAMELYKRMLADYPGSVYVVDARSEYRKMQDSLKQNDVPATPASKEDLFFNGKPKTP